MLIEDPLKFALVIPTYEGTAFLRRCLDYLDSVGYPGQIVLSDDSSGESNSTAPRTARRTHTDHRGRPAPGRGTRPEGRFGPWGVPCPRPEGGGGGGGGGNWLMLPHATGRPAG